MAKVYIRIVQSALLMLSLTLVTAGSSFARGNFGNAGGFGYNNNGYNNNVQPGNVWQGGRNNIYKNNNGPNIRPNYPNNYNHYNNNFNNNYNNNYNNNPYRNYRNYNNQGYPYNNYYYNGSGGSNDDYINAGPADNANCPLIQVCGATGCLLTPSC